MRKGVQNGTERDRMGRTAGLMASHTHMPRHGQADIWACPVLRRGDMAGADPRLAKIQKNSPVGAAGAHLGSERGLTSSPRGKGATAHPVMADRVPRCVKMIRAVAISTKQWKRAV